MLKRGMLVKYCSTRKDKHDHIYKVVSVSTIDVILGRIGGKSTFPAPKDRVTPLWLQTYDLLYSPALRVEYELRDVVETPFGLLFTFCSEEGQVITQGPIEDFTDHILLCTE